MAFLLHSKLEQFELRDGTGVPAASYYLHFFTTGTTTYKNTYPTEADAIAGTNANANPIQLDSQGRSPVDIWIVGRYARTFTSESTVPISSGITTPIVEDAVPASGFQSGTTNWGGTAGGTATALTLTLAPAITAYGDGLPIRFRVATDNTGAATLNVNSVGAKSIVKYNGTGLAGGELQANDVHTAVFDSTNDRFMLQSPPFGESARADVASATTTNLDTTNTAYVRITVSASPITAFTLANGRSKHCVADGAFSITTGASLLVDGFGSGATVTVAAGDTFDVYGEASGVVRISGIRGPGSIVGFAYTADGTTDTSTTVIPADDTIPQNTEGEEYTQIATAYTPRYANSLLRVRVEIALADVSASMFIGAIFRDTTADAVSAQMLTSQTTGEEYSASMQAVTSATAAAATTFKFRYGPGAAGTAYVNRIDSGATVFSTARKSMMTIEEIRQ